MKRIMLFLLLITLLILYSCPGDGDDGPQTFDLQIDGYNSGDEVGFQAGFEPGEEGAVTLGPVDETYTITKVEFLFGGTAGTRDIILNIYEDIGETDPGNLLYSAPYGITASNTDLREINLSSQNITRTGGGSIRVSIEMTASGLPSIARDDDGSINTTLNWIQSGGDWSPSANFGVTGDWVIRATVETE